jgi:multiple sugar transport system substrate-binding protein
VQRVGYDPNDVFPEVAQVFARGDRIYALAKGFTPFVIYYNRKLFGELGVETPPDSGWTWDQFLETARQVTRDTDGDGRSDIYALSLPRRFYEWIPFVWSAGGDAMDPEGRHTAGYLDSPETVDALAFISSLSTQHQVVPPLNFQDEGDPMRVGRFYTGRQAMLASGHWHMPRLHHYATRGDLEIGIARVPHRAGSPFQTVVYAAGWAVPSNVRHRRLAVELAAFLAGEEAQRIRAASKLEIPALVSVALELAEEDATGVERAFLQQIPYGRAPWGALVSDFHEVERMSLDIMDAHLLRGTPLQEAATDVARRIDRVIAR